MHLVGKVAGCGSAAAEAKKVKLQTAQGIGGSQP